MTIHIASINTKAATELAIRSALRLSGAKVAVKVGDCGSADGSIEMLQKFARLDMLTLEVAPHGRSHAAWLDHWLDTCETPWAAFLDSDVQLCKQGWLSTLLAFAKATGAPVVGGERTLDDPEGWTAEGESRYLVGCDVAPWIMLCNVSALRALGVGFAPVHVEHESGRTRFYDVASRQQEAFKDISRPAQVLPEGFGATYRHFRGLSWRRDPGVKGRIRHEIRHSLLKARLMRERSMWLLARER